MGVRWFATSTTSDTTLVTTAETVVATLAGVSTNQPGQSISFEGSVTLTTGGSTTGATLRIRRDSLTGTVIGEAVQDAVEAAAGSVETHQIDHTVTDEGEFSGRTYVLTVAQVAAAANGTATQAHLNAAVSP